MYTAICKLRTLACRLKHRIRESSLIVVFNSWGQAITRTIAFCQPRMSGPRIGTLSSSGGGGRGAQPAAANPGGPGGAPQNWLQEWQERTPFVTRWAIYITLPLSLLCLLWEAAYNALSNSPRTFLAFELWRPITALPNSGSALDLPFTLLMLAMTGPSTERALGSSRFASFMLLMGVIINVHYSLIMVSSAKAQRTSSLRLYYFDA